MVHSKIGATNESKKFGETADYAAADHAEWNYDRANKGDIRHRRMVSLVRVSVSV